MDTTNSDSTKHYAWLGKLIAEDRNSEESTCDLVLESEGKEFPVHKNVLMLVSKYFKKMFTIEMKEKYEGIVKMLQIPYQRLANLIEFVYSGRIKITEDNVADILDDAQYTELDVLEEICKKALLKLLSADNCLKLRAYAQRHNLDEVLVKTNQEIAASLEAVVQQDDFMQLNLDDMSAVIKFRHKVCEEVVFTGILNWVNHNPDQREKLFMDLIAQVDFTSMSSGFLAKVSKENLVRNNGECLRLLVDAVVKVNEPTSTGGKFMLVGGRNSPTDCVIYDVNTRKLTHLPKLNTKRIGSTSVKVRTKVYVSGGVDLEAGQSCEMLDLDQQIRWNMLPNLLESHENGGSCFVAGHIIVTGGWNCNHGILPSCEKFGFHNNTWVGISNMLHARADHGTAVCNDLLYCIGGYDENEVLSSCERYNMRSGNWNEIAPLSQARQDLTCVVSNGNIYAIGGLGVNNECLSTVERFIPRFGKWQNMASLTVARCHASACVIENKIFVIGGFDGEKDIKSIEVYDPVLNVWTIDFELKKPVREATVVAM